MSEGIKKKEKKWEPAHPGEEKHTFLRFSTGCAVGA